MVANTTPNLIGSICLISLFFLVSLGAKAQNEVAIGSPTTKPNAILWLKGNGSQGLLLPVVTNKSTVSSPEKGMIVYDDADGKVWYHNASSWVEVSGGGTSTGGTVTSVTGTGPVTVTNSTTTPVINIATLGITNGLIANDAITSLKIQDGTITGSDIQNAAITANKLAQDGALAGQVLKWDGTKWVAGNDDTGTVTVPTLNNGQLLVGNGTTNTATTVSGDATLSGGTLTISNGAISGGSGGKITDATITNDDIATAAAIGVTKIAAGTNGQVLTTVGIVPTWQTPAATTDAQDLALTGTTLSLSNDATPVVLGGLSILSNVTSAQITNSTITDADIATAAAIGVTKIAAGTNGQVLTTVGTIPTWQTLAAATDAQDLALTGTTLSLSNDATPVVLGGLSILSNVTSAEIANATITSADMANGSVAGGNAGIIADATITNDDIATAAAIGVTKIAAGTNGQVLTTVGTVPTWQTLAAATDAQDLALTGTTLSLSNDATPVVLGGLSILSNVTSAEITNSTITDADIAAAAGIAVTKLATGTNGQVLTTVGTIPTWQTLAAATDAQDLALTGTTLSLSNDATPVVLGGLSVLSSVTSAEIVNATITSADMANGSVAGGTAGIIADATITNADIAAAAAIAVTKLATGTNGQVLTTVGTVPTWQTPAADTDAQDLALTGTTISLSNDATPVVLGGLSILGSVTSAEITNSTITDADIAAAAAIAVTKLATGTNGQVLTTVGTVPTWQTPAADTDAQDLALTGTTISLSNDATPVVLGGLSILGSVTSAEITDLTITDSDVAAAAAIAGTKISPDFGSQNMATTGTATVGGGVTGGASGQFIVDGTGNITRINNLVTSFPAIQGLSGSLLTNDGAGNLTWTSPDNGWSLLGNAGTTPGTNFIGTTDANDLVFKTNNTENLRLTQAGNVGIGTSSPLAKLSVRGKLYVRGDGNTPSDGDVFTPAFDLTIDDNDTGFDVPVDGQLAVFANITEIMRITSSSVGIGTTTPDPTAKLDIDGSIKITDGTQGAGKVLTSDGNGFATWQPAGAGSGWALTGNAGTVNGTNFIGTTDGQDLSFKVNGLESGRISVNDQHGVFFGVQAGELQTEGSGLLNTGLGAKALWLNVTGDNNTAVGQAALLANKASNNTAIGQGALGSNVDGIDNTAVGALALVNNNNIAGNNNTALGKSAMDTNTSGHENTVIGKDADVTAGNLFNATALGYDAQVNANNKVRIGNTSVSVIEGQVGFSAASDIRFKRDIKDIDAGLDIVTKLRPVSYRMKNDDSRVNWGFIAQEIESLIGTENAVLTIGEDKDRTLGLRYSDFVAPLVKSVQELNAKIEQLEAENQKLKADLSEVSREKEKLESENGLLETKVNTIQSDVDEIKRILSLKASKN